MAEAGGRALHTSERASLQAGVLRYMGTAALCSLLCAPCALFSALCSTPATDWWLFFRAASRCCTLAMNVVEGGKNNGRDGKAGEPRKLPLRGERPARALGTVALGTAVRTARLELYWMGQSQAGAGAAAPCCRPEAVGEPSCWRLPHWQRAAP